MKRSRNASVEIQAIEDRELANLGIVRIVDQPSEVVQRFSEALSGEQPLSGQDNGWSLIGGIRLGTTSVIKTELGQPILEVNITALPGADFEAGAIYPVLVKRDADGVLEKLSIDFTSRMEYANLSERPFSMDETLAVLAKLGLGKAK